MLYFQYIQYFIYQQNKQKVHERIEHEKQYLFNKRISEC